MVFVTVSENREQLTGLTQLLVRLMPGCTIHQNYDPVRAIRCFAKQKVDVVFVDGDVCSGLLELMMKHEIDTSVYYLGGRDLSEIELPSGVCGVITAPVTDEKIRTLLQHLPKGA